MPKITLTEKPEQPQSEQPQQQASTFQEEIFPLLQPESHPQQDESHLQQNWPSGPQPEPTPVRDWLNNLLETLKSAPPPIVEAMKRVIASDQNVKNAIMQKIRETYPDIAVLLELVCPPSNA